MCVCVWEGTGAWLWHWTEPNSPNLWDATVVPARHGWDQCCLYGSCPKHNDWWRCSRSWIPLNGWLALISRPPSMWTMNNTSPTNQHWIKYGAETERQCGHRACTMECLSKKSRSDTSGNAHEWTQLRPYPTTINNNPSWTLRAGKPCKSYKNRTIKNPHRQHPFWTNSNRWFKEKAPTMSIQG